MVLGYHTTGLTVNTPRGYTKKTMNSKKVDNRLKRLSGQLSKIQEDIQNEKDCLEVITQFMAVKGALASAFAEYVQLSLDTCSKQDEVKMKQLITVLVKS